VRPPDPAFADPRLAVLYDALDDDRSDLDAYVALAEELGARSVVDVGCGTGSLAVRLAERGLTVVGVDPAAASLDVARGKPGGDRVTWVHGDATALAGREAVADLSVMTGNVAQVFVSDDDWHRTLEAVRGCLRPGGWFVLETRRPEARDWQTWEVEPTEVGLPDGGSVVVSRTVTRVDLPLVTFESRTAVGGEVVPSTSTLRFRGRREVEQDLAGHGFEVVDVREAPDRPGKELVLLARAVPTPAPAGEDVQPRPGDDAWTESRRAFADAAAWFVDTVGRVGDRWTEPGLGEWDVRSLVGHTSRSLLTVETYLARPAPAVEVGSTVDYFRVTSAVAAGPQVAERGREAGLALGDDPATAVGDIARRVLRLVEARDGTELVTTVAGGMRLADYLPTRTFELVIHTADLAAALGLPLDPPASAATQALAVVSRLAVDAGLAGRLLLAATGRPGDPGGFSVL
jgi:uncharacterized protein (TIGR03083 family)